jgi:hypothetical protein
LRNDPWCVLLKFDDCWRFFSTSPYQIERRI